MKTLKIGDQNLRLTIYQDGDADYWFTDISELNGQWNFNGVACKDKFRLACCSILDGAHSVCSTSKSKLLRLISGLVSSQDLFIIEEDEYGDPVREINLIQT